MVFTPSVTDVVDTLSLTAARKITAMVLKTPANRDEAVLKVRVQAFVREALVAAVQIPEESDTRSFRMTALGVLPEPPQVFNKGCTGFTLLGTDYISDGQGMARRVVTRIWFLAFADVGQEIARTVSRGDQLEVVAWVRTNFWPSEPGDRHSDLTLVVESFRFRRLSGRKVFRQRSLRGAVKPGGGSQLRSVAGESVR